MIFLNDPCRMSDSKYDVNTYSPEGRLYQIEYAMKASNLGTATLGITTQDSVILLSEKKSTNPCQKIESITKHYKIFDNIALSYSGIAGDTRGVVDISRNFALRHMSLYNENVSSESLLQYLCSISLRFSEKDESRKIFSRPFGCSILLASYEQEPRLYLLEPSGSYKRFKAKAIGSASKTLEEGLEKLVKAQASSEEAIKEALKMFKQVMKEPLTSKNIEILMVDKNGVKFLNEEEISSVLVK